MVEKLKVLDLFSGLGGFSLGLERTGGFETVAFCEIKEFPRLVLAKHWPDVPIFKDVRNLTSEQVGAVDVITGGFPCQDISSAGKQRGIGEGTRSGLWSEIARLVGELRPNYVIVENVSALLSGPRDRPGRWLGRVLGDLAAVGYDAEWHCIPLIIFGANHQRERIWIVAYPAGNTKSSSIFTTKPGHPIFESQPRGVSWGPVPGTHWETPQPRITEVDDGIPDWVAKVSAIGNAAGPQTPEYIGHAILEARLTP